MVTTVVWYGKSSDSGPLEFNRENENKPCGWVRIGDDALSDVPADHEADSVGKDADDSLRIQHDADRVKQANARD